MLNQKSMVFERLHWDTDSQTGEGHASHATMACGAVFSVCVTNEPLPPQAKK